MSRKVLEETLLSAAGEGDVEEVTRLIRQGVGVNCTGPRSLATPLHNAATGGHVGVVELLLKAGAWVGTRDRPSFDTPLHKAASGGHVGVAELLLKARAQVDSRNEVEATPLHNAASGGPVGVAELLLKAGARVDSTDRFGAEPLHEAARGGHVGVAELLLKYGARVGGEDEVFLTPEDIAAREDVLDEDEKDRILKGRKRILELFSAVKMAGPYRRIVRKVGPEGGELQTASCTVTVPPGAVTMETEITCQVINPSDVTLPLKEGEMLVSDVIELSPPGTTFHQPVTVQMQYSSVSLGDAREAVMWVTEDRSQWTELKTTGLSESKLSVSVDHFSIFAVISQLKQDRFTVPTEGFKLTSSTQPEVQISFPKQAVTTPTQVTIQDRKSK
ncbi:uncharacterized protein LOC144882696 [Branchiostoma floridae x Branchiostoma japonicum]